MRWVWRDIFSMEVPEDWSINELGDLIELVPPKPVGASHISVLHRKRSEEVGREEPILLLKNFAQKQHFNVRSADVERVSSNVCRGNFETKDSRGSLWWDVYAYVWNSRALVCSYCHDGSDQLMRLSAIRMFETIQPEKMALSWIQ